MPEALLQMPHNRVAYPGKGVGGTGEGVDVIPVKETMAACVRGPHLPMDQRQLLQSRITTLLQCWCSHALIDLLAMQLQAMVKQW